jgi:hypothetical protein
MEKRTRSMMASSKMAHCPKSPSLQVPIVARPRRESASTFGGRKIKTLHGLRSLGHVSRRREQHESTRPVRDAVRVKVVEGRCDLVSVHFGFVFDCRSTCLAILALCNPERPHTKGTAVDFDEVIEPVRQRAAVRVLEYERCPTPSASCSATCTLGGLTVIPIDHRLLQHAHEERMLQQTEHRDLLRKVPHEDLHREVGVTAEARVRAVPPAVENLDRDKRAAGPVRRAVHRPERALTQPLAELIARARVGRCGPGAGVVEDPSCTAFSVIERCERRSGVR